MQVIQDKIILITLSGPDILLVCWLVAAISLTDK